MSYLDLSIKDIHQALLDKKTTPLELTKEALLRAHADTCNSFEYICENEALEFAKTLNDVEEDNLLYGIPYLLKDNFSTKDIPSCASSNILNGYIPIFDATVVKKLKDKKAILIGKTTMDELAMGGSGTTGHKGITYNPYDISKTRLCGGSSCGSAAAVAQGITPFALGSDTGDSVRKPASFNSLVGFKPTWGRISRFGLFPFAPSLDHVAYFTRSVEDAAIVLDTISGRDKSDSTCFDMDSTNSYENLNKYNLKGCKIVILNEIMDSFKDEQLKNKLNNFIELLKSRGAIINYVDFNKSLLDAIFPTYFVISCAEATSNNANLDGIKFGDRKDGNTYQEVMINTRTAGFSELIKRRFVIGSFVLMSENREELFIRAQKARRLIVDRLNEIMKDNDILLTPAAPSISPKIKESSDKLSDTYLIADNHLALENFSGMPSITIPFAFKDDMPFGINLSSKILQEDLLLSISSKFEELIGLKGVSVRNYKEYLKEEK